MSLSYGKPMECQSAIEFLQCGCGRNWKLFFQIQLRTDNTPREPNTYTSSSEEDYLFLVQKSRRMRWAGHVAHMGEDRGVHRVLVGKPEGKRPLGRPRRRWEDNIKIDLREVGGGRGDWMELAQDRGRWRALVGTVRHFRVP